MILTRSLKVETSQLNGVCRMKQRHFLAVGEASFPGFGLCSFSVEQNSMEHIL